MPDAVSALKKAHRNNIRRYRRLLESRLTDIERSYIHSRISEEQSALRVLLGQHNPALRTQEA